MWYLLPAQDFHLTLTRPKFLTISEYTPDSEPDSTARTSSSPTPNSAWQLEVERHQATKRRLEQLLHGLA